MLAYYAARNTICKDKKGKMKVHSKTKRALKKEKEEENKC